MADATGRDSVGLRPYPVSVIRCRRDWCIERIRIIEEQPDQSMAGFGLGELEKNSGQFRQSEPALFLDMTAKGGHMKTLLEKLKLQPTNLGACTGINGWQRLSKRPRQVAWSLASLRSITLSGFRSRRRHSGVVTCLSRKRRRIAWRPGSSAFCKFV